MKFLILGVALLFVSQVRGEDLLHSIFSEKTKELKQAASTEVSTDYQCNAKKVVADGNQLVKNTLDIIVDTFQVIYSAVNPGSLKDGCTLGTFRCMLKEVNDVKDLIVDVKGKMASYTEKASGLSSGIGNYFTYCLKKK